MLATPANYISTVAWDNREFSKFGIHRLTYTKVKEEFGLGAQATVRTIAKVADAYNSGDQKFRRTHSSHGVQPSPLTPETCLGTLRTRH